MSKTETGKIENEHTVRVLREDQLDAVSGGDFQWGIGRGLAAPRPSSFYDALITS